MVGNYHRDNNPIEQVSKTNHRPECLDISMQCWHNPYTCIKTMINSKTVYATRRFDDAA